MHILDKEYIREFLESHREISSFNDCWLYTEKLHHTGYGCIEIENKQYLIHRLSFWAYTDFDLNSSLKILHKIYCSFKHCFNPGHLYSATQKDNVQDAIYLNTHQSQINKMKTHCKRGHEFTKSTTRIRSDGRRECKVCAQLLYESKKVVSL